MIKQGDTISVHYTGKFPNGEIFDSSEGKSPLTFKVGDNLVISGFEKSVLEKAVGDKFSVSIPAAEGYGEFRDDLLIEVSKTNLPEGAKEGDQLQGDGPTGKFGAVVKEVTEEKVLLDLNHPMAGKEMIFDIEILSIS